MKNMTKENAARLLGLDENEIKTLEDEDSSQLIIDIARNLYMICGGDTETVLHFMRTENVITGGIPALQMNKSEIKKVANFLDKICMK